MTQAIFNPNEHLRDLKGSQYLDVKWRLVWFRDKNPHGRIGTAVVEMDMEKGYAVFRAFVDDEQGGHAEGYGSETAKDFRDFIEKAETKAIGRALAALGYGTQFAPEMDEGERIVDSPVLRPATIGTSQAPRSPSAQPVPAGQPKAVLEMIARAKERTERVHMAWDSVKRDTFGGNCPADETLTVQMVAQINGVLTVVEKGMVGAK
jgi:hypothetical protein